MIEEMANATPVGSFELLPVELLHRIFDYLDTSTILFDIRPVCRRFRSIAITYDRYKLDFRSVSQEKLHVICRLIRPFNVISLILAGNAYTPSQIDEFNKSIRLRQFNRLQSISLFDITEGDMNFIFKRVNIDSIHSFSIYLTEHDDRRKQTTKKTFNAILTKSNLRHLNINSFSRRLVDISWPSSCSLQSWVANESIDWNTICIILNHCSSLQSIILKKESSGHFDKSSTKCSSSINFPQLKSFTMEKFDCRIDDLEHFLLFTPSLNYLKLHSGSQSFDAARWENFIQATLPHLETFAFDFYLYRSETVTLEKIETYLNPFRTPFWIEHKKWFVVVTSRKYYQHSFRLYSLSYCFSLVDYEPESLRITVSTYPETFHRQLYMLKSITELDLTINDVLMNHIQEETPNGNIPYFSNVTALNLSLNLNEDTDSFQNILVLVDYLKINRIQVRRGNAYQTKNGIWLQMKSFLENIVNLSELVFETSIWCSTSSDLIENMISVLPAQLKHLTIAIQRIEELETIMDRCQNLSSIKLHIRHFYVKEKVIEWFSTRYTGNHYQKLYRILNVWLGKRNVKEKECESEIKRMKLSKPTLIN